MLNLKYEDYLYKEKLPLFWCEGCGNGIVLQSLLRAFADLELNLEEIVVVTGIGCWGKADDYVKTNTFHGTHGRALAFATGIKLANPKLKVIALMGDGDCATIGGNHLIHTARRNIDITAIMVNNFNYGMTGGQYSGTTPEKSISTTSIYGHMENNFDVCNLAMAAGAPYVARGTIYNPVLLQKYFREGIERNNFSFIEVITQCPTHFGKLNKMSSATGMVNWIKDNSISLNEAKKLDKEQIKGKFVLGKFIDEHVTDYGTKYQNLIYELNKKEANHNE